MEYIASIIIAVLVVLFIAAALFFWGRREEPAESSTGDRAEAVKTCYNLCRDNPKQTFYSCATMCTNTVG